MKQLINDLKLKKSMYMIFNWKGNNCRYYSLDVSYFKSALDRRLLESLWNKYWVNTLSSSSLLTVSNIAVNRRLTRRHFSRMPTAHFPSPCIIGDMFDCVQCAGGVGWDCTEGARSDIITPKPPTA